MKTYYLLFVSLVLRVIYLSHTTIELISKKDEIYTRTDMFIAMNSNLCLLLFLINCEIEEFGYEATSHRSTFLPETHKLLLTTKNEECELVYINALTHFVKYHRWIQTMAETSLKILIKIVDHPGVCKQLSTIQSDSHQEYIKQSTISTVLSYISDQHSIMCRVDQTLLDRERITTHENSNTSIIEALNNSTVSVPEVQQRDDLKEAIGSLFEYFIKHNISFEALEDLAALMNRMPGTQIALPTSRYLLFKEMQSKIKFKCSTYRYCAPCKKYSESNFFAKASMPCETCSRDIKLDSFGSYIHINMEAQIKKIVLENWATIVEYSQHRAVDDRIEDVRDGDLLKQILAKNGNGNILTFTFNTDGVKYEKSNAKSIWPLQLICNFLPPSIRFNLNNIIIAGLFWGEKKPNVLQFFRPFSEEAEKMELDGFIINGVSFKVFFTHGTFDLPAKAQMLNMKQFNGYYSCGYCHHPGTTVNKQAKYTNIEPSAESRTHEEIAEIMETIKFKENMCIQGIKGLSPLASFRNFDLVHSLCIDYMHNVLIGVVATLLDLWLSPSSHEKPYYISPKNKPGLDKLILKLKLCQSISRKPRSMAFRKQFKASEYRSMLLYYLGICLTGLLDRKYIDHFRLLSSSIYKMLGTQISQDDLIEADQKLKKFVKLFEEYYGSDQMNMNIHLLVHIPECVKTAGPLWCFSMFSFEGNNGVLRKYFHGTSEIISQIALRYLLKESMSERKSNHNTAKDIQLLQPRANIKLCESEIHLMNEKRIVVKDPNDFHIYTRFKDNNETYTSIKYTQATKTIDYFAELSDGTVAEVKYYFIYRRNRYAFINQYVKIRKIDHIDAIEIIGENVVRVKEIVQKCIFLEVRREKYVVLPPNKFEKD